VTCPHCGDTILEQGLVGLDLCDRCGGISRDGQRITTKNQRFQAFAGPQPTPMRYAETTGTVVGAALLDDGRPAFVMTFTLSSGRPLGPLVVAGDLAANFARLVDDAWQTLQRTQN
jgi:hypothetical protein